MLRDVSKLSGLPAISKKNSVTTISVEKEHRVTNVRTKTTVDLSQMAKRLENSRGVRGGTRFYMCAKAFVNNAGRSSMLGQTWLNRNGESKMSLIHTREIHDLA